MGTCGLFDGSTWSVAAKTSGGRLLLYSPSASSDMQYNYLHVNKTVTALAAGALDSTHPNDMLLIGSTSSLQAYNVLQNSDAFFIELPGSVHSIIPNTTGDSSWPVVLAGGQGFVVGCTIQGQVVLHITISDTATALALVDVDGDGRLELVVGSSDGYLRVYRQSTLVEEVGWCFCGWGGGLWDAESVLLFHRCISPYIIPHYTSSHYTSTHCTSTHYTSSHYNTLHIYTF